MTSAVKTTGKWRRWEFGAEELRNLGPGQVGVRWSGWPSGGRSRPSLMGDREISTAGGLFLSLFVGATLWILLLKTAFWLGPKLF